VGLFLAGALIAWVAILVVVLAACRAAAHGDLALAPAAPRGCEARRRRRAVRHVLDRVR
jgi:hypothetical protein